jgi:hypothetical protein
MLLDMLSARSYLELSQEDVSTLSRELSPEIKAESDRHLRPRKGPTSQAPGIPDRVDRNLAAPDRPVRKRGRPRLDTAKDATAIEVDLGPPAIETLLTRPIGTPSADPTGATHLSSQKGEYHPGSQISRQYTRADPRECIRYFKRSPLHRPPQRRCGCSAKRGLPRSHTRTHSSRNKQYAISLKR